MPDLTPHERRVLGLLCVFEPGSGGTLFSADRKHMPGLIAAGLVEAVGVAGTIIYRATQQGRREWQAGQTFPEPLA